MLISLLKHYTAHKVSQSVYCFTTSTATPTLVDPVDCKLLGMVDGGRITEETPSIKKKKLPEDSPKTSKKKASKPLMT